MTQEETDKIFYAITSNGCRYMDEIRFNQAVNEALEVVKNCSIPDVVLSLPDDEAIEQWWAEGKDSDKFWQDAPYRTNGDVVEEIKTALKYFITVWQ